MSSNHFEFTNSLSISALANAERKVKADSDAADARPASSFASRRRESAQRARDRAAKWRPFFRSLTSLAILINGFGPPIATEPDRALALAAHWKDVFVAKPRRPELADSFLIEWARPYDFSGRAPPL